MQGIISTSGFMKRWVIILSDPYLLSLPVRARCLLTVLLDWFSRLADRPHIGSNSQICFIVRLEVLLKTKTRLAFSLVCSSIIVIIIIIIIITQSSCLYRASMTIKHFIIQQMHKYIIRRYN